MQQGLACFPGALVAAFLLAAVIVDASAEGDEEVTSKVPPPLVVPPVRIRETRRGVIPDRSSPPRPPPAKHPRAVEQPRSAPPLELQHAPPPAESTHPPVESMRHRPAVARMLIDELFLGNDPMQYFASGVRKAGRPVDEHMTHVSHKDVDMVLAIAPQPVRFWLELGSFEGGSAILAAQRAKAKASEEGVELQTTVVAVDTFLGDFHVLWGRPPEERQQLLRPDGTVTLYDKFRANVLHAGHEDVILPLPATSISALRVVQSLVRRGVISAPEVIYLDSAHAEGEVFLELQLAWRTVMPGGIVFGDDWVLPVGEDRSGEVQRDVLRFAEARQAELDDELGPIVQPMRTLGRPRPGLFVSYQSFQWFMRKRTDATEVTEDMAKVSSPAHASGSLGTDAGFDCWSDGYSKEDCCDEQRHGAGGNPRCWDLMFTFEQCCRQPA